MLPLLRRNLKGVSVRNQSLQDILKTMTTGLKVVSIEPITKGIHNTKLTLQLITGEQRVHFYNRLPLESIIAGLTVTSNDLDSMLSELNLLGCDFTEDDLIYEDGLLICKPSSLGYIGGPILLGDVIPVPNIDTFVFADHPAWTEPLYDLMINDVLYDMGSVKLLDTCDHIIAGDDVLPFDPGHPSGLRDLIDMYAGPESTRVLFRNKTNQQLTIKFIPRVDDLIVSHDRRNQAAYYDGDGIFTFVLLPKQEYNRNTDDLVVQIKLEQDENSLLMLGIDPSYDRTLNLGDFIEVEIDAQLSYDGDLPDTVITTNPDTGAKIYHFDIATHRDAGTAGITYIWLEFEEGNAVQTEMRIRSSRPIHQLELWNVEKVINWGKYVADQPYEIGDNVNGSSDASVLTNIGETSNTFPGAIILGTHFTTEETVPQEDVLLNVYETVKRGGDIWDLVAHSNRWEDLTNFPEDVWTNYFFNKPKLISRAVPVFGDINDPKYFSSVIKTPIKTLEIRIKATLSGGSGLRTLASAFPAETSIFSDRVLVGQDESASHKYLSWAYDAESKEDVYTVDVDGFIESGTFVDGSSFTQNDIRLLLKARWDTVKSGKVNIKTKGFDASNNLVHDHENVFDTNIFGKQSGIWKDFLMYADNLHLGGLTPNRLDICLMGHTSRSPNYNGNEAVVYGFSGQTVLELTPTKWTDDVVLQSGDVTLPPISNWPRPIYEQPLTLDKNGKAITRNPAPPYTDWMSPVYIENNYHHLRPVSESPKSIIESVEKLATVNPNDEYSDVLYLLRTGREKEDLLTILDASDKAWVTPIFTFSDGRRFVPDINIDLTPLLRHGINEFLSSVTEETNFKRISWTTRFDERRFDTQPSSIVKPLFDEIVKVLKLNLADVGFVMESTSIEFELYSWEKTDTEVNGVPIASQHVANMYFRIVCIIEQDEPILAPEYIRVYNSTTNQTMLYGIGSQPAPSRELSFRKYTTKLPAGVSVSGAYGIEGDFEKLKDLAVIDFSSSNWPSRKLITHGNVPEGLLSEPYRPFTKAKDNRLALLLEYVFRTALISY